LRGSPGQQARLEAGARKREFSKNGPGSPRLMTGTIPEGEDTQADISDGQLSTEGQEEVKRPSRSWSHDHSKIKGSGVT